MANTSPPPTPELAALSDILGLDEARDLTRTFLADTPRLIADLDSPVADRAMIAAHSLKSTSRIVGANTLSALAATLEVRLLAAGPLPTITETAAIRAEYACVSPMLIRFSPRP